MLEAWLSDNGWLVLGIALIILEWIVPGFVLFFFGLSALAISLITYFIVLPLWIEIFLFVLFSLILTLTLRQKFLTLFLGDAKHNLDKSIFKGKLCVALEDNTPNQLFKVEFKGANGKALSTKAIQKGAQLLIVDQDNITLIVEKS